MMKSKHLLESFNFAIEGIVQATKNERNLKIHFFVALGILGLCFLVGVSTLELAIVIMMCGMVISAELINTSIEAVIDLYCGERRHPLAKLAKDVAAGGVFVSAITATLVGFIIFYDDIDLILQQKYHYLALLDIEIAIIILMVVTIGIILIKVWNGRQASILSGGFPSGHSSLAFAAATMVLMMSDNTLVGLLGFFLALLVAQSRVEGKIHSLMEVLAGAVYGIVCVVVIYRVFLIA